MKALQRMEPFRKQLWTRCLVVEGSSSTNFNSAPSYGTAQNDALFGNNLPQDSSLQQSSLDKLQLSEERLPFHNEKSLTSGRLFPSASRRSEVRLPGLTLCLTTNEVLEKGSDRILDAADSAIARGITIVILESGVEEASGGAQLYKSVCVLKALLRGRADLLISERLDIAAAAGADGVLLSDKGNSTT